MKLVKRFSIDGFMSIVAAAALLLGITSTSNACFFAFNQPKVPQGLDKFKKEQ